MTVEELVRKCSALSKNFEFITRVDSPPFGDVTTYEWRCSVSGVKYAEAWRTPQPLLNGEFGKVRLLENALRVLTDLSQTPDQKRISELESKVSDLKCEVARLRP